MPDSPSAAEIIASLEAALDATHDGILVLDLNQRILRYNRRFLEMFGVSPQLVDAGLRAVADFIRAQLEDPRLFLFDRDDVWTDPSAEVTGHLRFKDGRVFERYLAPYRIGSQMAGRVASYRDVTDEVRVASTLEQQQELEDQLRQSQKMEAIGRLAGGIAHDLNNALTAIAGYAELAIGQLAVDHAARTDVEEIRRAAERAAAVTRQLLAFSRKQLLEPKLFDLNDTVASIARLLTRLLGPAVDVRTNLAPSLPAILGDPGQVEQAIMNLAVNARDAMPRGGQLDLATSAVDVDEAFARTHGPMPPGRYVVLCVRDTGHGMSRETQAHIFEPFFTTKDVGKGTGLGLSMVYGTVKQIGGFVFVESEIDRGTTFRLYFPPAAVSASADVRPTGGADTRRDTVTLLVVEDETAVRNLVASALGQDGYQLLLASSAEEALTMVAAQPGPLDLLLTDANLPGKSGVELANTLAAEQPGLRVIIMSGYTEEALNVAGLKKQPALLAKPFTPRDLRRRIREVLEG